MLKKCVVIMALFALVAGAASADVTVGGMLQTNAFLLSGDNVKESDVNMGGAYGDGPYSNSKLTFGFGDGTAGGRIVYDHLATDNGRFWGWLAWRPNQYFRMKVGSDEDGEWGVGQIAGWGFTGEAKNSVAVNDYNGQLYMAYRWSGLNYGGFDNSSGTSLGLSVYPIDGLQVNLLFKGDFHKEVEISERFAKMHLIASYYWEGIGTIRFVAEGKGGLKKEAPDGSDIATLWFAFHSKDLVEGLAFEVGANFNLPHLNEDTYDPTHLAAGINLTKTDPFGLKFRIGSEFGGKKKNDAGDIEDIEKTAVSIGLLPSYKLAKMTIYFHAGLGLETPDKDSETIYKWFINPYIWVPVGNMRLWAGVQILDNHVVRDGLINWNVPFGFHFYF